MTQLRLLAAPRDIPADQLCECGFSKLEHGKVANQMTRLRKRIARGDAAVSQEERDMLARYEQRHPSRRFGEGSSPSPRRREALDGKPPAAPSPPAAEETASNEGELPLTGSTQAPPPIDLGDSPNESAPDPAPNGCNLRRTALHSPARVPNLPLSA